MFKNPIFYIVLIALLIRLASVAFGLPHVSVYGDETGNTIAAFKIMDHKSLVVPFSDKHYLPPLYSYLLIPIYGLVGIFGIIFDVFSNLADFKEFVILYREWFMAPSRVLAAAFGAGTVYLVYLFAKKLFDKKVALFSSFLLAFNFLHVHESQVGHIWSPIVFFTVLSAYGFYLLYLTGERKWYLISAIGLGLGYAVGQIGIIFYPFFVLAHLLYVKKTLRQSSGQAKGKFFEKRFIESNIWLFVILIVFTLLNFYTVYKHFYDAILPLAKLLGIDDWLVKMAGYPHFTAIAQKHSFVMFGNWVFMLKTLFFNFPVVFAAYFLAAGVLLKKYKKDIKNILLLGLPFYTLLVFSVIFYSMLCRYILVVIPFVVIAASYFVFWLWEKISPNKNFLALSFLVVIVSFYSVTVSVFYSIKLLKPYTVSSGVLWIYENVPPGKRVVSNIYLNSNKESVEFLKKYNMENWIDVRKNYILNVDESRLPKPNYLVIETDLTDVFSLPEEEKKADYAIIFFYEKTGKRSEEQRYAELDVFGERELVASFYPKEEKKYMENLLNILPHFYLKNILESESIGPNVEVYKFNLR